MARELGHLTSVHPKWLDTLVSPEYEDEQLYQIILFFVIHSPCNGQSWRGISLSDRGWKEKPWYSPVYLKEKLDIAIFSNEKPLIKMVNSKPDMIRELSNFDLSENFYQHRDHQRALFVKSSEANCSSLYMGLFYHIRNALAHGRLAMYPAHADDVIFVMEDGKDINHAGKKYFEVSARIVILKSSLLRVIDLIEHPPQENDYTEDILTAIRNNCYKKETIMKELGIDGNIYERATQKMRLQGLIFYKHARWYCHE